MLMVHKPETVSSSWGQEHYHYHNHSYNHQPSLRLSPQHFEEWFGTTVAYEHELTDSPTETSYEHVEVYDSPEPEQPEEETTAGKRARKTEEQPDKRRKRRRSGDEDSEDGERKMRRSSRACLGCRKFKVRCMPGPSQLQPGEEAPCARCAQNSQHCVFVGSNRGKYPVQKLNRLKKVLDRQEEMLRLLDEICDSKRSRTWRSYPAAGPSSRPY